MCTQRNSFRLVFRIVKLYLIISKCGTLSEKFAKHKMHLLLSTAFFWNSIDLEMLKSSSR
jgi:hypothetical protein